MKERLFVAVAAVLLAGSSDIPANRKALDEAGRLITIDCGMLPNASRSDCRAQQADFVINYFRAMAGQTLAMRNLAIYFARDRSLAVNKSILRSCAWAMQAEMSPNPPEDGSSMDGIVDKYFDGISANDLVAAKSYAISLGERISSSPVKLPRGADGDTWPGFDCDTFDARYAAQGKFAPPRCTPVHEEHLDATVAPLKTDQ